MRFLHWEHAVCWIRVETVWLSMPREGLGDDMHERCLVSQYVPLLNHFRYGTVTTRSALCYQNNLHKYRFSSSRIPWHTTTTTAHNIQSPYWTKVQRDQLLSIMQTETETSTNCSNLSALIVSFGFRLSHSLCLLVSILVLLLTCTRATATPETSSIPTVQLFLDEKLTATFAWCECWVSRRQGRPICPIYVKHTFRK